MNGALSAQNMIQNTKQLIQLKEEYVLPWLLL